MSCAVVDEKVQQGRTSLIPETLRELSEDREQQALVERLQQEGQASLSKEERRKRQRSLDSIGAPPFQSVLRVCFIATTAAFVSDIYLCKENLSYWPQSCPEAPSWDLCF